MYRLRPTRAYMLDSVRDDLDALARTTRMARAFGLAGDSIRIFRADQAFDVVRELDSWTGDCFDPDLPCQHQRAVVFTKIRIDDSEIDRLVAECPPDVHEGRLKAVLGQFPLVRDTHNPEKDRELNLVCWNTQDFGVMRGCAHGCHYCGSGKTEPFMALGTNIGEYMEKVVAPAIDAHPGQKCFRMLGWAADISTLEPEYDVFRPFLAELAKREDRYGYFHTAGDNVDWVRDVPHRDRLIGVWSMTPDAVAERLEPASPSGTQRIEAARKCQEWGLPVRFKFKPMIPVRDWRNAFAGTIADIFASTRPESIGFCVLMWMPLHHMKGMIDPRELDPTFLAEAERAADDMRDVRVGPFPHHVRKEVYRFLVGEVRKHDKSIPLYLSTESREMWDDLQEDLGQDPSRFICGCNPIQAPGPRMLFCERQGHSTYIAPDAR